MFGRSVKWIAVEQRIAAQIHNAAQVKHQLLILKAAEGACLVAGDGSMQRLRQTIHHAFVLLWLGRLRNGQIVGKAQNGGRDVAIGREKKINDLVAQRFGGLIGIVGCDSRLDLLHGVGLTP